LYEILSSLRSASSDAASSSSVLPAISTPKSVTELLSEVTPVTDVVWPVHVFFFKELFDV